MNRIIQKNKAFIILIMICFVATFSFAQKPIAPTNIGISKEFVGWVTSNYMYDGDWFFTLKDAKNQKFKFYFNAGSCHTDGDPYSIEYSIDEDLMDKISNLEPGVKSKLKVKVSAKSTYGLFCGNCDGCTKNKQKIWRPVQVVK